MKQSRVIGIALAIANVILVVACAVLYLGTDRTEPKMEFKASDVVYRSGMDEAKLLNGIAAYDSNDGDVTDKIVIEKIIENEEENSVVVFYAVSDRAGNVAKCSRVFQAVLVSGKSGSQEDEVKLLMEAGIEADLEAEDKKAETSKEPEETDKPSASPSPTPTATPTPTAKPEPTPEPTPQQPAQPAAPTVNPAAPILTFKTSQVQINAGDSPAWVDIIETMRDDQDNYETLYYNLNISKYDKNKPGTYPVTVYTEDSEGNKSQTSTINIIVK